MVIEVIKPELQGPDAVGRQVKRVESYVGTARSQGAKETDAGSDTGQITGARLPPLAGRLPGSFYVM